jgi:hypothetical protein
MQRGALVILTCLALLAPCLACAQNTTWNPSDTSPGTTLSDLNLIVTGNPPSSDTLTRSTTTQSSGLYYFELTSISGSGPDSGGGIANGSASAATFGSNATDGAAVFQSGNIWITGSYTGMHIGGLSSGAIVGVAVNLNTSNIWFRNGASGQWNGSSTADPASGTGGLSISGVSGPYYIAASISNGSSMSWTVAPGTNFAGAVPSGYSAWGTSPIPPSTIVQRAPLTHW